MCQLLTGIYPRSFQLWWTIEWEIPDNDKRNRAPETYMSSRPSWWFSFPIKSYCFRRHLVFLAAFHQFIWTDWHIGFIGEHSDDFGIWPSAPHQRWWWWAWAMCVRAQIARSWVRKQPAWHPTDSSSIFGFTLHILFIRAHTHMQLEWMELGPTLDLSLASSSSSA